MNRIAIQSQRQIVVFGVLLVGLGALFSPAVQVAAQPPEPKAESGEDDAFTPPTPQPLATPPDPADSSSRSTRAVGTLTGQGTVGSIAKFTGTNSLGNSVMFENGGKIGVGTTTPTSPLSVKGVGANNYVIYGLNSGTGNAVIGSSTSGVGVSGLHSDTTTDFAGVLGETASTSANAAGILGTSKATSAGASSAGVRGVNKGVGATGYGVYGSQNGGGSGVYGNAPSGNGVLGDSATGNGVHGRYTGSSGTKAGVLGETNSTASSAIGVLGIVNSSAPGSSSAGVRGINSGTGSLGIGIYGSQAGGGYGVYGFAPSGYGSVGASTSGKGIYGSSNTGTGVQGFSVSGAGVNGSTSSNTAQAGLFVNTDTSSSTSGTAVRGLSADGSVALIHPSNLFYDGAGEFSGPTGVIGAASKDGGSGLIGIAKTTSGFGVYSFGNAYVNGNLSVTGTLSKSGGSFKIDHPLHPATKYLSHSFVESPDMMNVYNGNAKLDDRGEVVVTLPDYFQTLNRDFRYQLTCIGAPALVYVAQEIRGNRFKIAGGKAGMKVSWQVTGVRNDAYAREHRIRVEENKTGNDRGRYLYPAGFGAPASKQIGASSPRLASR